MRIIFGRGGLNQMPASVVADLLDSAKANGAQTFDLVVTVDRSLAFSEGDFTGIALGASITGPDIPDDTTVVAVGRVGGTITCDFTEDSATVGMPEGVPAWLSIGMLIYNNDAYPTLRPEITAIGTLEVTVDIPAEASAASGDAAIVYPYPTTSSPEIVHVAMSNAATASVNPETVVITNPVIPSGPFASAVVVLVKSAPEVPPNALTFDDLDIADFTGYAASSVVTWGAAVQDNDQYVKLTGDKKQFRASGSATGNSIYGAALVNIAEEIVYQYDEFVDADGVPAPVDIEGAGSGLDYTPTLMLQNPA